MAKKTREKTEEVGSASVSPYGSVLAYEEVKSKPSHPITVVWPEYRTWFRFIGPCREDTRYRQPEGASEALLGPYLPAPGG